MGIAGEPVLINGCRRAQPTVSGTERVILSYIRSLLAEQELTVPQLVCSMVPAMFVCEVSTLVGGNTVWNGKRGCHQVPAWSFFNDGLGVGGGVQVHSSLIEVTGII